MKKKTPDFKRKHLDEFLHFYKCMVTNHEKDMPETLDQLSNRILGGANTESSAFRTYNQRLIYDGLIREDIDKDGNKRWMASGKGLTHSYVWERRKEVFRYWANVANLTILCAAAIFGIFVALQFPSKKDKCQYPTETIQRCQ